MNSPVIYIFLNKSLHMSVGKASAQAVHAAMLSNARLVKEQEREIWSNAVHKTVIVLEARDDQHIVNIALYLQERGINTVQVVDEGVNEIAAHTMTALATPILDKDSEETSKALSTFSLYREIARFNVEFER